MQDYQISNRMSRDVIALLVSRGMTLTDIAGLLDVTKSFMSRVKAGTRSLTLDHLAMLEEKLGEPVPYLLIKSIPIETVKPELLPLHEATLKLLTPRKGAAAVRSHKKKRSRKVA